MAHLSLNHDNKKSSKNSKEQKMSTSSSAKYDKIPSSSTNGGSGTHAERSPDVSSNGGLDSSLTRRRSRQNAEFLINSLNEDDIGLSEEDDDEMDMEEEVEEDVLSVISRESPTRLGVRSIVRATPKSKTTSTPRSCSKAQANSGGSKFKTPTKEERKKERAAVVELFDDSVEDEVEEVLKEDPLIDTTPDQMKQTRTETSTTSKRTPRNTRNKSEASEKKKASSSDVSAKDTPRQLKTPANKKVSEEAPSSARLTRSQARGRDTEKRNKETVVEPTQVTKRSLRGAKSDLEKEGDKSYRHDDLEGLSSESEWNSEEESSSSSGEEEEEMEFEVNNARHPPHKSTNAPLSSKSRKRTTPNSRLSSRGKAKKPRLSLSSRKVSQVEKIRKVRTVEKKDDVTGGRRNGPTATPSRRKVFTPSIPQRKKVVVGKSTKGSRASQFEEAKQRYMYVLMCTSCEIMYTIVCVAVVRREGGCYVVLTYIY